MTISCLGAVLLTKRPCVADQARGRDELPGFKSATRRGQHVDAVSLAVPALHLAFDAVLVAGVQSTIADDDEFNGFSVQIEEFVQMSEQGCFSALGLKHLGRGGFANVPVAMVKKLVAKAVNPPCLLGLLSALR